MGGGGCAHMPQTRSRIEPGAVADAALCRRTPLPARQETQLGVISCVSSGLRT